MMLHLGVIDQPHLNGKSSYEVAVDLEKRYGLFSEFAKYDMDKIHDHLLDSLTGSLETLLQGGSLKDPFAAATDNINQDFRDFLEKEVMATLGVGGVPTKAALMGKSSRFKGKTKKGRKITKVKGGEQIMSVYGPKRPSFIDTGITQTSFKSWVD